jgi:hypothetical protein
MGLYASSLQPHLESRKENANVFNKTTLYDITVKSPHAGNDLPLDLGISDDCENGDVGYMDVTYFDQI